jgi:FlaA1/EpsC-like NDP-sugar epimerase
MKNLLITGGSGFLGRSLGKKFKKKFNVFLASRNSKNNFLAEKISGCKSIPLDVSNIKSVYDAIQISKADIIIHAAATKFVGWSEKFPFECTDININGSANIVRAAIDKKVKVVIGISTDKATQPIKNFYGMSKAVMEKIFYLSKKQSKTKFVCVRYGNVAWSTGSVLPIWKEMYHENGIIQTTGPNMRRFFFTIDDAVDLVNQALKKSALLNGKILCPEMKSSKMINIIKIWLKEYGGKYKIINERDGDRLDEYLISDNEIEYAEKVKFDKKNYYIIDFSRKSKRPLKRKITSLNCKSLSENEIRYILNLGL